MCRTASQIYETVMQQRIKRIDYYIINTKGIFPISFERRISPTRRRGEAAFMHNSYFHIVMVIMCDECLLSQQGSWLVVVVPCVCERRVCAMGGSRCQEGQKMS